MDEEKKHRSGLASDDAELVSECLCDETRTEASQLLYETFTPLVRAIVARVLREWVSEWDDACQTVFIRLFSRLHQWRGDCPFDKYVGVVAARVAISVRRELLRQKPRCFEPLPDNVTSRTPEDPDLKECIEHTVANFNPEWRRVVELVDQGLTRERVAQELGRPRKTIQNWLVHIRERLLPCVRS
ncbi:MAG: RNA polymerase sigma factor [Pirellulaceae bacterium]